MRYTTVTLFAVVLAGCGDADPDDAPKSSADRWDPCLPPLSDGRWFHRLDGSAGIRLQTLDERGEQEYNVREHSVDYKGDVLDVMVCAGFWRCGGQSLTTESTILSSGPEDEKWKCDQYERTDWACGAVLTGCVCQKTGDMCISPEDD